MNSLNEDHNQVQHRNNRGQFTKGNKFAGAGGRARASQLTPERRKEIARAGYHAMVLKHFGGDFAKANSWLIKRGLAAQDPAPWNNAFNDPGPHPAKL